MPDEKAPIIPAEEREKDVSKKKIAGKFDTLEEAVEMGYVGLEKQVGAIAEGQARILKVLESALSAPAPIGSRGRDDDGYRRQDQQIDDDSIDPAKFLLNPGEFLAKRDEKLASKIVGAVVDLVGNMNAVNQFKADNPDLLKHEKIVQAFMHEQPKNLSSKDKLEAAGKAAREYLKSLKVDLNAGNPNPAPKGQDYVEGPSGGTIRQPLTEDLDPDGEAGLVSYIQERQAEMASHFAPPKK